MGGMFLCIHGDKTARSNNVPSIKKKKKKGHTHTHITDITLYKVYIQRVAKTTWKKELSKNRPLW